jgi:hypothetical protein
VDYVQRAHRSYDPVSFWDYQQNFVQMLVEKIGLKNLSRRFAPDTMCLSWFLVDLAARPHFRPVRRRQTLHAFPASRLHCVVPARRPLRLPVRSELVHKRRFGGGSRRANRIGVVGRGNFGRGRLKSAVGEMPARKDHPTRQDAGCFNVRRPCPAQPHKMSFPVSS